MLQSIREKHQTKIFNKYHCFFAFSTKQFEEGKNKNFEYIPLGAGLYAPKEFGIKVIEELDRVHLDAVKECQSKHTLKEIIWYELANYETQISDDLTEVRKVLKDFDGITEEMLMKEYNEFYNHCVRNELF